MIGANMGYEEYAKALEGKPLFHIDGKRPKCGACMDHMAFDYRPG